MLKKFKQWYYKRIVFVCGNDEERAYALHVIDMHNAKIERMNGLWYKFTVRFINPFYLAFANDVFVVRGRNLDECEEMLREFNDLAGGFVAYNPKVMA